MANYIAGCDDHCLLKHAIDTMILDLLKNLDAGYDLKVDIVIESVLLGITLETFNMLALNINKELREQEKVFFAHSLLHAPYDVTTIH